MARSDKQTKHTDGKHTKHTANTGAKFTRQAQSTRTDLDQRHMVWVFHRVVRTGKFSFTSDRSDFDSKEILDTVIEYNQLTWAEIMRATHGTRGKTNHHYIGDHLDDLSKAAKDDVRKFVEEQQLDKLFSFRLNGKTRIYGLRDGEKFEVMWYDPNHEFYPTKNR